MKYRDSDIPAEPNDVKIDVAATVSEIQDIHSGSFFCQNCRKTNKTKRGLNRYQPKTYEKILPQDAFEQFVIISKVKLANDQCLGSLMGEFPAFFIDKECIKNVNKLISNAVLSFKWGAEKFCPAFYKSISDAENLFGKSLNKHPTLLVEFELANHGLSYLSGSSFEKDSVVQFKFSSTDFSNKVSVLFKICFSCIFS